MTDNDRVVARILPQAEAPEIPYFARRKPSAAFKRLEASGKTGRATDSTITIFLEGSSCVAVFEWRLIFDMMKKISVERVWS